MKSNAPWSVKGIERDARETAKAAAQREGMTVGEWLNQIIYTAGDPDAPPTEGDIDGLKARDLASAIEHLSRRIAAAEQKSAAAVDGLSRSLGGAVERLQRIERSDTSLGGDPDLADRVRILEEKGTDRQRIEALKALERAVGQIAVQFSSAEKSTHSRLDAAERQLQTIAGRIETGGGDNSVSASSVREAIEGMADRIARAEKIAAEASKLKSEAGESTDADFVHKTGLRLRILGDEIKRSGDQMRTLEGSIARLTEQIDAAEKRSAEGVQKVAETIADLREQFSTGDSGDQAAARVDFEAAVSEITQRTEDRIEHLQKSFDDMVRRLETAGGGAAETLAGFDSEPDAQADPKPLKAEAAPQTAAGDAEADLDQELEDAFAALELEEPIPTPVAQSQSQAAAAPQPAAEPDPQPAASIDDDDDFNFNEEDKTETADVLAEIREAFGIDGPSERSKKAAPADEDDADEEIGAAAEQFEADDETAAEPPPLIANAERTDNGEKQSDYLKAARQAAREAAARAAAEENAGAKRKKLSPRQRAILAARAKKRKAAQAEADAKEFDIKPAPDAEEDAGAARPKDGGEQSGSLKARIAAVAQKIKLKAPAKKTEEENFEAALDDDAEKKQTQPNLAAGANAALKKLNVKPTGGVIAVAVAGLLLVAALFLVKDMFIKDRPAAKPPAAEAPRATPLEDAGVDDRLAPASAAQADATVRPRDLYIENISALKNATNDTDARAALAKIEQAATLGHPPAQLQIGELYKLGQLYDRDLVEARMWFERAANGGNVLAMHRLGVMSARGEGGPVDIQASIDWFEKAAGLGLVDSQYNLGATFHPTPDGAAGGVQDRAKAYFWYSIAAKNGDTQAGEMAVGLAASMPEAEKSAKDAEVAAWAPKTPDPSANELAPTN